MRTVYIRMFGRPETIQKAQITNDELPMDAMLMGHCAAKYAITCIAKEPGISFIEVSESETEWNHVFIFESDGYVCGVTESDYDEVRELNETLKKITELAPTIEMLN